MYAQTMDNLLTQWDTPETPKMETIMEQETITTYSKKTRCGVYPNGEFWEHKTIIRGSLVPFRKIQSGGGKMIFWDRGGASISVDFPLLGEKAELLKLGMRVKNTVAQMDIMNSISKLLSVQI